MLTLTGVFLTWLVMSSWEVYGNAHPVIGKLIAGLFVMIFGYYGRKYFVFVNDK